jgi:hypothetical protein
MAARRVDRSLEKMIRHLIVIVTCVLLSACDSDITEKASYPPPDGKRMIVVVEELEARTIRLHGGRAFPS